MTIVSRNAIPTYNYRLPAEWETHEATWLGWPHNKSDWPGKFTSIPWVYAEIVRRISREEKVRIIAESKDHEKQTRVVLKSANVDLTNVEFFILKTDRGWTRDSGPALHKKSRWNRAGQFQIQRLGKISRLQKRQKTSGSSFQGNSA